MTKDDDWGRTAPRHRVDQTGGARPQSGHGAHSAATTPSPSQIETLLHSLVHRLEENDNRYNAAIQGIEERLNILSSRAGHAGAETRGATADSFNRLGAQASDLADQIRRHEQVDSPPQAQERFRTVEDKISDFAASIQRGGPSQAPESAPYRAPERDPYQAPPSRAPAMSDNLQQNFTSAAAQFEQTLAAGYPTAELEALNTRVDDLVQRLDAMLADRTEKSALQSIEGQLEALSAQFAQARHHYSRVDAIEANLVRVLDWAQSAASHVESAAQKAAQDTARSVEKSSSVVTDWLDVVQRELQALNTHAREIDGRTLGALESMNSSLKSLAGQLAKAPAATTPEASQQVVSAPVEPRASVEPRAYEAAAPDAQPAMSSQSQDRSQVGAAIPDYQEMPRLEVPLESHAKTQTASVDNTGIDSVDSDRDFLASARRAAAAAASQPPRRERRSLLSILRRKKTPQEVQTPVLPKEGKTNRPVMVVAVALLLAASAALLYARMKDNSGNIPVALPLPETQTAPPQTSQRKDSSKLPGDPAMTPRASKKRAPLVIEEPAAAPQQAASDKLAKAEAPKLASLPELPVEPDFPGLAVTIQEPGRTSEHQSPPNTSIPAAPTAPAGLLAQPAPLTLPKPAARSLATAPAKPAARSQTPSTGAPMPPLQIGPQSLRLAAARGNREAQFEIATRYADGKGVKKDQEKAYQWYARAASKGLAPAQYRIAALHERGRGVKQDLALARIWYERAAKQGNVKAMHNLAVLLTGSKERKADHASAAKWFGEAARHGLADSQYNLGILYEAGLGVTKSPLEAYQWFALAAARGDKEAAKQQQRLGLQLRPNSIQAANQSVRMWRAKPVNKAANEVRTPKGGWRSAAQSAPTGEHTLITQAQTLLNKLGYNAGIADGVPGQQTEKAVRRFETRSGLVVTGKITPKLVRRLKALSS